MGYTLNMGFRTRAEKHTAFPVATSEGLQLSSWAHPQSLSQYPGPLIYSKLDLNFKMHTLLDSCEVDWELIGAFPIKNVQLNVSFRPDI